MNLAVLAAFPPAVVIVIVFPVFAPAGTIAVTCVSELTVKLAALPPIVTAVVCVRLMPVIVTEVPTGPLGGLKFLSCGGTMKMRSLLRAPVEVVTVIEPVSAPEGTVAVR